MTRWFQILLAACACALTAALCWCVIFRLAPALDAWGKSAPPDLSATVTRVNALLDQAGHPCAPGPCGLLPAATKAVTKSGDAIATTQLVERSSAAKVNATMDALATIPEHVNMSADAATGVMAQAQVDLVSLNAPIKAVNPLLLNAGDAVSDLDALLKDKAVHDTLTNVDAATASGAGILANGKTVTDKITYDFMHPVPAWKQPRKILQLGFDAALLAK